MSLTIISPVGKYLQGKMIFEQNGTLQVDFSLSCARGLNNRKVIYPPRWLLDLQETNIKSLNWFIAVVLGG